MSTATTTENNLGKAQASDEREHLARFNRLFALLFWAHLPILVGVAWWQKTPLLEALLLGAAVVVGPTLLTMLRRSSVVTAASMAIGSMALSAVIIHVGRGMIEMHFHIFAVLPLLAVYGRVSLVLLAAAVIAAHHIGFFFFLPRSVFNYDAGFEIVVVHALFVVAETVGVAYMARVFRAYVLGVTATLHDLHDPGAGLQSSAR